MLALAADKHERCSQVNPAKADVLVIGAGVGGSVASAYLAEHGCRVVCLEQGRWVGIEEFPGNKPEWEVVAQKQWHPNPNVRAAPADYPCVTSESDVNPLMYNAVGGSTILFGAQWARFLPSDFRTWTLDGVGDDWPFTYADLLPYYERQDLEVGVAGLGGDPAYPPGAAPPLPAHPINRMGRTAALGMNRLGWHWWPGPNAIPTRPYGELARCQRYGTCLTGCPSGAKASFDHVYWPRALRHGAQLVTGARVCEITTDRRGRASGAIYVDREGRQHRQAADVVVLAANGIGSPRLLLNSASSRFPDGLANSSGLVGKRLMMHPYAAVIGIYSEDLHSWMGPAGQMIHSFEFYETDESRGFVRGAKWDLVPTGGPLGMRAGGVGEWGRQSEGLVHDFARRLHETVKTRLGHGFEWGIIAEDLPEESNQVTLDSTTTDEAGIPAPRIAYRTSSNTQALLEFHIARVIEAHEAAGATETIVTPLMRDAGWHHLGTARMGSDPCSSVVDEFGRSHDVSNLFIVDGSVFPTSSGVNPAATIAATALRSVEHLVSEANLTEVPQ